MPRTPGTLRRILSLVLLGLTFLSLTPTPSASAQDSGPIPAYAYYYIWFTPGSWRRAAIDFPLLGRYSSDDARVLRTHVRWAKQAGIDGFIVSWKDTDALTPRLENLVEIAREEDFELAIIYQGLNFERRPLPVSRVAADLQTFARRWGDDPVFARRFGQPVVIWSGTWEFSTRAIRRVETKVDDTLLLLGSERSLDGYERLSGVVEGNAYYWSSVDPGGRGTGGSEAEENVSEAVAGGTPGYRQKLVDMGRAVHEDGGLWFAPAAPGFDARAIGGWRVIQRRDGATLRQEMSTALSSSPDVLALISWNEFSENTHIEPSERHGRRALEVVAETRGASAPEVPDFASDTPGRTRREWGAVGPLIGLGALVVGSLGFITRRRMRQRAGSRDRTFPSNWRE